MPSFTDGVPAVGVSCSQNEGQLRWYESVGGSTSLQQDDSKKKLNVDASTTSATRF
jgi:hypothetical protein